MRHKEACLRITCLTVCKDLLWAGTSAGVIVTVAIPRVTLNSTKQTMEPPQLEGMLEKPLRIGLLLRSVYR